MIELSTLSMTDIIRLQSQLQQELARRFECTLALVFTDIVGSTAYFAQFGDAAGRQLQQLHVDLLLTAVVPHGGRIVDTAGDGAFLVFPSVALALEALAEFEAALASANATRAREQQLAVRMGVHWGVVLSDGVAVSGDAVNMCARVAATALAGQARITRAVYRELGGGDRLKCRSLGAAQLNGFARPVELFELDLRGRSELPVSVLIHETGEVIDLPLQESVSFGRVLQHNGVHANDVALNHPDPNMQRHISRWHFELRRSRTEMHLHALSDSATSVDGRTVERGHSVPVSVGSRVRVGHVLSLELLGPEAGVTDQDTSLTMVSVPSKTAASPSDERSDAFLITHRPSHNPD